jgi:hypothetical protein
MGGSPAGRPAWRRRYPGPAGLRLQGDLDGRGAGGDGLAVALVPPGEDDPPVGLEGDDPAAGDLAGGVADAQAAAGLGLEHGPQRAQLLAPGLVQASPAVAADRDQAGVLQHPQVLGRRRRR